MEIDDCAVPPQQHSDRPNELSLIRSITELTDPPIDCIIVIVAPPFSGSRSLSEISAGKLPLTVHQEKLTFAQIHLGRLFNESKSGMLSPLDPLAHGEHEA